MIANDNEGILKKMPPVLLDYKKFIREVTSGNKISKMCDFI